jgi:pullulanase
MKLNLVLLYLATLLLFSCNRMPKYASFEEYPVYEGSDLELIYGAQSSKFRVWAPIASEVKLLLYDNGAEGGAYSTLDMKRSDQGTWALEVDGDLKGKFYTFQIKLKDKWMEETPGIWVKATGMNGKRAAVVDFTESNPDGWDNDVRPPLNNFTDIVMYGVHFRDFSMSPTSGIKNKGKYLAFTEHGTKNSTGETTGIDHLKELGVTHINLSPCFDFADIDETKLKNNKYSWGTEPLNFNVPEGSYSSNPSNPIVRIREFKRMVQSIHQSGMRVILDVDYTHTANVQSSHLNLLAPGYFYRQNKDSSWSNATGFGNETASERPMMRKLMIESLVYWVSEYHIDGFNFNQMGVHDLESMNAIRAALDKIDPDIFLCGDGLSASTSTLAEEKRALKSNGKQLDFISLFNDDLRNVLRDSAKFSEAPGFVSGTDSLENGVRFGVIAATQHTQINYSKLLYSKAAVVNNPTQTINYVSTHTDLCLADKLLQSKPSYAKDEDLIRYNKLAQTIICTSQGIPYLYAGDEFYRSKKGVRNTGESPDSINQINWDNKTTQKEIYDYSKNLLQLRKEHPAFRMPNQEMLQTHLQFLELLVPNIVAYVLSGHVNGEKWKDILVIYNGNPLAKKIIIPQGNWNVVCHDGQINLSGISTVSDTTFIVAPSSASILYQE